MRPSFAAFIKDLIETQQLPPPLPCAIVCVVGVQRTALRCVTTLQAATVPLTPGGLLLLLDAAPFLPLFFRFFGKIQSQVFRIILFGPFDTVVAITPLCREEQEEKGFDPNDLLILFFFRHPSFFFIILFLLIPFGVRPRAIFFLLVPPHKKLLTPWARFSMNFSLVYMCLYKYSQKVWVGDCYSSFLPPPLLKRFLFLLLARFFFFFLNSLYSVAVYQYTNQLF